MNDTQRHRLLSGTLAGFVLTAILCFFLHRTYSGHLSRQEGRLRILKTLVPDQQRLSCYEAIERALRQAQAGGLVTPTQPEGWPIPERREMKRLAVAGDWRGVQLEMAWPQLETEAALAFISYYSTNFPAWRLSRLNLDALESAGKSRLDLVLESAEPASD